MKNTDFNPDKNFAEGKREAFISYCWKSISDLSHSFSCLGRVIDAAIYSFRENGFNDPENDTFSIRLAMQFQREIGVMMGIFHEDGFTIRTQIEPQTDSKEALFDTMFKRGTLSNPEQASWLYAGLGRIVDAAIYSFRENGMNDPEKSALALCEVMNLQRGLAILMGIMILDGFTVIEPATSGQLIG